MQAGQAAAEASCAELRAELDRRGAEHEAQRAAAELASAAAAAAGLRAEAAQAAGAAAEAAAAAAEERAQRAEVLLADEREKAQACMLLLTAIGLNSCITADLVGPYLLDTLRSLLLPFL